MRAIGIPQKRIAKNIRANINNGVIVSMMENMGVLGNDDATPLYALALKCGVNTIPIYRMWT